MSYTLASKSITKSLDYFPMRKGAHLSVVQYCHAFLPIKARDVVINFLRSESITGKCSLEVWWGLDPPMWKCLKLLVVSSWPILNLFYYSGV